MKEAQIALADRDRLRAETLAKDEVILALQNQINALRGLLQIQQQISKDWQEAATARRSALAIDDKIILTFETELTRVRGERDSARKNGRLLGLGGFILGAGLALLAQRK